MVFAYSDIAHAEVMHRASRALAAGADFILLGPNRTMLRAARPVKAVSAVRTGCGKSQTARWLVDPLRPGHETSYHPGEAVLRMADVVAATPVDLARLMPVNKRIVRVRYEFAELGGGLAAAAAAVEAFLDRSGLIRRER